MNQFRLLPSTILLLGVMMVTKSYYAYNSGKVYYHSLVSDSYAEEEKKTEEKKVEKKPEAKKEESANADEAKKSDNESGAEKADAEKKEGAEATTDEKPKVELPPIEDKKREKFTQTELDLLQSLSKRREELDAKAKELSMREDVLKATEVKLDKKIDDLKNLKGTVENLLAQYNEHEDAKIKSLVKIYESMKPAQAAEIFNQLDNSILLRVIDKMKEAKAAPILANMKPEKAKQVTIELANAKRLPDKVDALPGSKPDSLPASSAPKSN